MPITLAATLAILAAFLWSQFTSSPAGDRVACAIVLTLVAGLAALTGLALVDAVAALIRRVSRGSCTTR